MSRVMRGHALIIVMTEFRSRPGGSGVTLEQRRGAKRDADRLFRVLSRLGYDVTLRLDISAAEIKRLYREESKMPQGECFISILSSHGEEGMIYDFFGESVQLRELYHILAPQSCPQLAGKPKLFFIQACRGTQFDEGVMLETDSGPCHTDAISHMLSLPRDTVVIYASTEGYVAFQNPLGSVFLQTLCDLLEGEERDLELMRILTRLCSLVAYGFQSRGQHGGYKEMPCYVTNLTREVYPFRQPESG
ncbi:hypothetical protein FKM82_031228 [Ascaphus truei]